MKTGLTIRAHVGNRAQAVDLGDPRLTGEQVLRHFAKLADDQILRTIDAVKWALKLEENQRRERRNKPRKRREEPDVLGEFLKRTGTDGAIDAAPAKAKEG